MVAAWSLKLLLDLLVLWALIETGDPLADGLAKKFALVVFLWSIVVLVLVAKAAAVAVSSSTFQPPRWNVRVLWPPGAAYGRADDGLVCTSEVVARCRPSALMLVIVATEVISSSPQSCRGLLIAVLLLEISAAM